MKITIHENERGLLFKKGKYSKLQQPGQYWLIGGRTTRARSLVQVADEHAGIVGAIAAHDATFAEASMQGHLFSTGRLLVAQAMNRDENDPEVMSVLDAAALTSPTSCDI